MAQITKKNFDYLTLLKKNNNRDWFTENKAKYIEQHEQLIAFADKVLEELNKHDNIETPTGKKSLLRIYRDVRFSKNKEPYKTYWGAGFRRATKELRGGYYLHLEDGKCFVGGGFWSPNKEDLLRIREDIAADDSYLREVITAKPFVDTFGTLEGEQLKTSPKGFDKDHPAIDLLRYKQFVISKQFTNKEVFAPDFYLQVVDTFVKMRPFLDYMSSAITTDANGESIL